MISEALSFVSLDAICNNPLLFAPVGGQTIGLSHLLLLRSNASQVASYLVALIYSEALSQL